MKKYIVSPIKYIETRKYVVTVRNLFYKYPASVIIIPGIAVVIFCLIMDYKKGVESKDLYGNLTASAIEVFGLGAIIMIYNKLSERKNTIKRYKEEIDSYRPWKEEEATYRICGLVKSLNNMNDSKIDLSSCYLIKASLSKANLQGANLNRANLTEANLSEANLSEANLLFAKLIGANLEKAILKGADLTRANLTGAKLNGTGLSQVKLQEANFQGAYLRKANLSGVRGMETNFTKTELRDAELIGAKLFKVSFNQAILCNANLQGVDLPRSSLQGADLQSANLQEAKLKGANLQGAIVESRDWLFKLEKYNIQGIEYIKEKYCVIEDKSKSKPVYRIEEKGDKLT